MGKIIVVMLLTAFSSPALHAQSWVACKGIAPEWISLGVTESLSTEQTVSWRSSKGTGKGQAQLIIANPSPDLELKSRTINAMSDLRNDYGIEKIYHRVTFDQLKPDTKYLYRVGNGSCWSEWFQFKTAKSSATPFSFLFFGDVQYRISSLYPRVVRQAIMQAPDAALMMFTGDLTTNATDEEFSEFFWAGSWMLASKPVVPIPDNHEYREDAEGNKRGELASFWNHTFSYPRNVPKQISQLGNYYFDYQNTRFIMINNIDFLSNKKRIVYDEWLKSVLKNNPQKWTVVAHHHPVLPISARRQKTSFYNRVKSIYDQYGVDLVLTGHDHGYSRGGIDLQGAKKKKIEGPVYVVSVAGPGMYALAFRDWYDRVASNTQMFQHVTMGNDQINFKAYTATGVLYDEFVIRKKNGNKTFVDMAPDIEEYTEMPLGRKSRYTAEQLKEIEESKTKHLEKNRK